MNLSVNRKRLTDIENNLVVTKGAEEERIGGLGLADANYVGWINETLLYSTGNYIQNPVINHNRKGYQK